MVASRWVAAVVIVLSCVVTGGVAGAAEPPGPVPPLPVPITGAPLLPDDDPFYRAPAGLDHERPGTVLRSRRVAVTGPTTLASASAYQLLLRSTDARGAPIAAATTVLVPALPAPGPRRLVSHQVFEDSLTTGCAPSYTMRSSSGLPQPYENASVAASLARGWDVVVPDHQGPRSESGIGPTGGRITLDSIRAVESFPPAALDGARTRVGLAGCSGGSTPTVWANALVGTYAPELTVVGSAVGGVVADIDGVIRAHSAPPFSGVAVFLAIALDRTYGVSLDALLTERGRVLARELGRDAYGCLGLLTAAPLDSVRTLTRYPDADSLLATPRLAAALRAVDLAKVPSWHAPTLTVQGTQDELVPAADVDAVVADQCRRGAVVDHRQLPGEHVTTLAAYEAATPAFLADRFAERPATNTCSAAGGATPRA